MAKRKPSTHREQEPAEEEKPEGDSLQTSTYQINETMVKDATIYQEKIKAMKVIKGETYTVDDTFALEESKEAFKVTLTKIGTAM